MLGNFSKLQALVLVFMSAPTIIFFLLSVSFLLICFYRHYSHVWSYSARYFMPALWFIRVAVVLIFLCLLFILIVQFYFLDEWLFLLSKTGFSTRISAWVLEYHISGKFINNFGWGIFFLCFITTFLSLFYLGELDFFSKGSSSIFFFFFLLCTLVMVRTTNLLILFVSYELIFFPSMYYVYTLGYSKKVDRTIYFLLAWTLFGSLLVLMGLAYLYGIHGAVIVHELLARSFTYSEVYYLYWVFFIGFCAKLPLFPFHYWLTKVHVEAPAGFSMFLSGFLVKTSVYCFYFFNLLFSEQSAVHLMLVWLLFCIIEASLKMWGQVDLKKLIAFATIQEMNMIMFMVVLTPTVTTSIFTIFVIMHGLLSVYMFFLVDKIQKITQTRNITSLSGVCVKYPILRFYIWVMLIFFFGLPLTVKFLIEWTIGVLLLTQVGTFGFFTFVFGVIFGSVGFGRCWFLIMYGNPSIDVSPVPALDFTKTDIIFSNILIFFLILLNLLIFTLTIYATKKYKSIFFKKII